MNIVVMVIGICIINAATQGMPFGAYIVMMLGVCILESAHLLK